MKKLLIIGLLGKRIAFSAILMLMMIALVSMVSAAPPFLETEVDFAQGAVIVGPEIDTFGLNETFTYHFGVFNKNTGVILDNTLCNCTYGIFSTNPYVVYDNGNISPAGDGYTINSTTGNVAGDYNMGVKCNDGTIGAYSLYALSLSEETTFGFWKPVEDWTFPIIYLVLTIILLIFAISYESSLMGVLGSVMLIMAYFIVGATSPILFTPLLIVGFLLAFKFATL